jgi:hypothetical protein
MLIKIRDTWVNPEHVAAVSPVYGQNGSGINGAVLVVQGLHVVVTMDSQEDNSPASLVEHIADRLQFAMGSLFDEGNTADEMPFEDADDREDQMRFAQRAEEIALLVNLGRAVLSGSSGVSSVWGATDKLLSTMIPETWEDLKKANAL